jgi:hypothetical protein
MTHFNQINQRSTHFFKFCLLAALMLFSFFLNAQKKFSLEVNYGANGNFFVSDNTEYAPWPLKTFLKKNFVGTIGGIEGRYVLNSKSSIGLGFSKSHNQKTINYDNGYNARLSDFNITHTNYFYALDYERSLSKKIKNLSMQLGVYYLRMKQQELTFSPSGILAEERNYDNSNLEEAGVLFGLHYFKRIDTKFDFGVKTRIYYTLSVTSLEAITITPTLRYNF